MTEPAPSLNRSGSPPMAEFLSLKQKVFAIIYHRCLRTSNLVMKAVFVKQDGDCEDHTWCLRSSYLRQSKQESGRPCQ